MSNDERRMSDWLDHELDRMAIEGNRPAGAEAGSAYASESERALSETIHRLRRLDTAHAGPPDPAFLNSLEQRLMSSTGTGISQTWSGPPLNPARQTLTHVGARFREERTVHRRTSALAFLSTAALILAIVATTIFVTTWEGGTGPGEPTNFAATGGDSTPAAGAAGPASTPADAADIAWSIPFPEGTREASTGLMLIENGLVYRQITVETGNEATGFSGVQAIRAADGEMAWGRWMAWNRSGFAADATGLYTVAEPSRIVALTPESGEDLWELILPSAIASMELRDGTLYVWDATNTMTAIDAATGETVWATPAGIDAPFELAGMGAPMLSSSVIIGEQTVAAIAADGTLVAFDRPSGDTAWSVPGFSALNSMTAVTDETALVLTAPAQEAGPDYEPYPDREGVGIDLDNGAIRWSITVSGEIALPVAPGGTGMFHLVADQVVTTESPAEASTPVVDATVGPGVAWPASNPDNPYGENAPNGNDYVYGIDAQTGQIVWQRSTESAGFAALYISNSSSESLWALTYDNYVIRLAGESGAPLDPPVAIPDPVKRIAVGSLDEGAVAETLGGTIYGFGHVLPDEQG